MKRIREPGQKPVFNLYILKIGGDGDYGVVEAQGYGLDKIFNRWHHHQKTRRDGQDWRIMETESLTFSTKEDRANAQRVYSFVSSVVDYDASKHTDCFVWTDDEIWSECELSDSEGQEDSSSSEEEEEEEASRIKSYPRLLLKRRKIRQGREARVHRVKAFHFVALEKHASFDKAAWSRQVHHHDALVHSHRITKKDRRVGVVPICGSSKEKDHVAGLCSLEKFLPVEAKPRLPIPRRGHPMGTEMSINLFIERLVVKSAKNEDSVFGLSHHVC
jgi:hypothetical protein